MRENTEVIFIDCRNALTPVSFIGCAIYYIWQKKDTLMWVSHRYEE